MGVVVQLLLGWVKKVIDFVKWVMRMIGGPSRPAPAPRRRPARERRARRPEPVVDTTYHGRDAVSEAADDAEDDDVASDVA